MKNTEKKLQIYTPENSGYHLPKRKALDIRWPGEQDIEEAGRWSENSTYLRCTGTVPWHDDKNLGWDVVWSSLLVIENKEQGVGVQVHGAGTVFPSVGDIIILSIHHKHRTVINPTFIPSKANPTPTMVCLVENYEEMPSLNDVLKLLNRN